MRSAESLDGNPVYLTMNGPNELTVVGNLKEWERHDRIHEITVPTLVTVGRYDEIPLARAQTLHAGIRSSDLTVFDQSSHVAMLEETEAYIGRAREFLDSRRGSFITPGLQGTRPSRSTESYFDAATIERRVAFWDGVSVSFLVGFHFRHAVDEGIEHGRTIADHAVTRFQRPVH